MTTNILVNPSASFDNGQEVLHFTVKALALLESGVSLQQTVTLLLTDSTFATSESPLAAHFKTFITDKSANFVDAFIAYEHFSDFYKIMVKTYYGKDTFVKCFQVLLETFERGKLFMEL